MHTTTDRLRKELRNITQGDWGQLKGFLELILDHLDQELNSDTDTDGEPNGS